MVEEDAAEKGGPGEAGPGNWANRPSMAPDQVQQRPAVDSALLWERALPRLEKAPGES